MKASGRASRMWAGAALLLGACLLPAAEDEWTSVGIGGGGGLFVPVSSPHDPRLMFIASDMSGVYRSTDAGRTWRMLNWRELSSCINCAIEFDPSDALVCYAVPGPWASMVLKVSRDAGLTWRPLCDARPWEQAGAVGRLGVSLDGKVILVAAEKGTFRTDDAGKTWTKVQGIATGVHRFFFEPASAGKGLWYVGTPKGVFVSDDRGKTWKSRGPVPGEELLDFCAGADPAGGQVRMYCSVAGRDAGGKYAGGIFRSDDRGATWTGVMNPDLNTTIGRHGPVTRTVAQYPFLGMATNQADVVYAYGYGTGNRAPYSSTVYRTGDAGATWKRVLTGPQYAAGQNVDLGWINYERGWSDGIISYSVNLRHKDHVAYSSAMEVFLTEDGGGRWRQAYTRCAEPPPDAGKAWSGVGLEMTTTWHIKFDPHERNRCYICYTDIGFARSIDRGKTWYYSPTGSPWANTFYDIAFDPEKSGVIYAACADQHDIPSWKVAGGFSGGGGVCLSTDHGRLWRPVRKGLPTRGACTAVVLDPRSAADRRTLYCTFYGGGGLQDDRRRGDMGRQEQGAQDRRQRSLHRPETP